MFVLAPLRKEMKERVDELLRAQRDVVEATSGLAEAIRSLDGSKLESLTAKWLKAAETAKATSSSLEETLTKISNALK
jgi:hypothetical protein